MILPEPTNTALLLTIVGALLALSVFMSRASARAGIPVVLLFLVIGMAAGSEGIGRIEFSDYGLSFRLGIIALVLILFDGGLNMPARPFRRVLAPSLTLATVGVALTAVLVAAGARLLGFGWGHAFVLGAVVSSTDAATVFSVLKSSGVQLKRRVGATLEVESGLNDPMAVLLTVVLTQSLLGHGQPGFATFLWVLVELGVGAALGLGIGFAGLIVLRSLRLPVGGLYPVFSLSLAFLAFGLPTLVHGSGFLAVYAAGVVLGNGALPYRGGILRAHDSLAWLAQVIMFLTLGLLVFPSQILGVAWNGLAVTAILVLLARPLAVALCLLPFRYRLAEILFIGWVGLRGAVPIILAIYPVLAGVAGATTVFNLVFFIVVGSVLVQGTTASFLARRLGLEAEESPAPPASLEILAARPLGSEIASFYVKEALAVSGLALSEIPFPEGSGALLVIRSGRLHSPSGELTLEPGDHVYVYARVEDRPFLQLLFGREEEA